MGERQAVRADAPGARAPRRSPTPRATTPRSRAGSPSARTTSRRSTRACTRRCSTSPTARTRTSGRPTTRRRARARTCCRWSRSCTARSCRSTTCSTSTRRAGCCDEFEVPAAVIVKHNNPCGVAVGGVGCSRRTRRRSPPTRCRAFGGVFCFNRRSTRALAEQLSKIFVELVFAPGYDDDALEILTQKPNVRILNDDERRDEPVGEHDIRRVRGGLLVQDRDADVELRDEMQVVTERRPDRGGVGRAAVRLEGLQARPLERDRASPRTWRRSASAPAR